MNCPCCLEDITTHNIKDENFICKQSQENICKFFTYDISNKAEFTVEDISHKTCNSCNINLLKCFKCKTRKIHSCQNIHCNLSTINDYRCIKCSDLNEEFIFHSYGSIDDYENGIANNEILIAEDEKCTKCDNWLI